MTAAATPVVYPMKELGDALGLLSHEQWGDPKLQAALLELHDVLVVVADDKPPDYFYEDPEAAKPGLARALVKPTFARSTMAPGPAPGPALSDISTAGPGVAELLRALPQPIVN